MTEGTGKTEMQAMILDVLTDIRNRLGALEKAVEDLTADVHTVHEFQKTFGERLSAVEQFLVDRPLRTVRPSPPPKAVKMDGGR